MSKMASSHIKLTFLFTMVLHSLFLIFGDITSANEPETYKPKVNKQETINQESIERISPKYFYEPTIGSWYGSSDSAYWYGVFGELTIWKEAANSHKQLTPGIDLMAIYSHGKVKDSSYKWDEKTIGGGLALKYAVHSKRQPWMWQLKVRILYENIDGDDSDNHYEMNQKSILLNPYTEYTKRQNDSWIWGLTAEGRVALNKNFESSIEQEDDSDRDQAYVTIFTQHALNDNLQGKMILAGIYQGWDDKSGIEISSELRIIETYMVGIKAAKIGSESVFTGFIRLEFGKPLRDLYQ